MTYRMPRNTDVSFSNEGSIVILYLESVAAQSWADEHLPEDRTTWGRNGVVVEWRYAGDILEGMAADGLKLFARRWPDQFGNFN